jgi:hypothetical protein
MTNNERQGPGFPLFASHRSQDDARATPRNAATNILPNHENGLNIIQVWVGAYHSCAQILANGVVRRFF